MTPEPPTETRVEAAAARELLENATPGPWIASCWDVTTDVGPDDFRYPNDEEICVAKVLGDAPLIAAAPDLARTVIALHERLAALEAADLVALSDAVKDARIALLKIADMTDLPGSVRAYAKVHAPKEGL